MASKGQIVEFQSVTDRWSVAVIAKIIDGDTVNVVGLSDGVNPWPNIETPNGLVAATWASVTKGNGVGQWRELALPGSVNTAIATLVADALATAASDQELADAIATRAPASLSGTVTNLSSTVGSQGTAINGLTTALAGVPTATAMNQAISAAVGGVNLASRMAVPAGGTQHSGLAFGQVRQNQTGRPVIVCAYGRVTMVSTLLAAASSTITMISDAQTTPTSERGKQPCSLSGVIATSVVPWSLVYVVPAGHYYKIEAANTGNATPLIDFINETIC